MANKFLLKRRKKWHVYAQIIKTFLVTSMCFGMVRVRCIRPRLYAPLQFIIELHCTYKCNKFLENKIFEIHMWDGVIVWEMMQTAIFKRWKKNMLFHKLIIAFSRITIIMQDNFPNTLSLIAYDFIRILFSTFYIAIDVIINSICHNANGKKNV